jgi:hypothetical protein
MKRMLWVMTAVVITLLLGAAFLAYAPREVPKGQPPLVYLNLQNFDDLRRQFNDSAASPRVLLMLSPT